MSSDLWIESEFDEFEENVTPGHRRTALVKYRSLRTTGCGKRQAQKAVLDRWGW